MVELGVRSSKRNRLGCASLSRYMVRGEYQVFCHALTVNCATLEVQVMKLYVEGVNGDGDDEERMEKENLGGWGVNQILKNKTTSSCLLSLGRTIDHMSQSLWLGVYTIIC